MHPNNAHGMLDLFGVLLLFLLKLKGGKFTHQRVQIL